MVHAIWDAYPDIQRELAEVRRIMLTELRIKMPDVEAKIMEYIQAPGKYLRSGLCLMFAKLCYGHIPKSKLYLAAAIEVLHLATLIHDDVIDGADTRRGIMTLHQQHSNRMAIYAGDYLMTYAARLASKGQQAVDVDVNPIDHWVLESILVGELNQLANQFRTDMSMYDYLRQIRGKTGLLFAASTFAGYYDNTHSASANKQAFYIGQAIGMAFQLTDDLIDYQVSAQQAGKPQLQDVQNGVYTAPLILAMNEPHSKVRPLLKPKGEPWSEAELSELHYYLTEYKAYERTEALVESYLQKAFQRLEKLTASPYRQEIRQLMETVMQRRF
ncbi:polyprenyl synthetase family protein [Aerococcaceae bacterium NML191292]|nr:polyprenyl synthetase family protein [Aerococcaceae bacterium NML210727]MCW6655162.1 polyprenyl synthetase family protein [Aerococcaceae bacterium NML201296]MCW6660374.1 polyprenyl synthetase family protein [Aerococcaceae bacterium NML191292]MCW6661903.1 polyprenyl synthetase family protein [Aerococcaceae bacterium NML201209]MCW6663717.1 polyprenyl synthetase family protein [Aerococcaceae bacterium NML190073]MCW6665583.1 polyprenyl synthetase family protein [Aerococcaceae bacterium NML19121